MPERQRVYENRIHYPMSRKNFDPNGDRHPELRGKDEYVRISWDEALDLVAGEITRIRETYGPAAITAMTGSHHNWGFLHYKLGPLGRFFNILGYSQCLDNPDSWEGWHWGATHAWGYWWRLGHCEQSELLQDALKNTEQIIFWSVDPNSTSYMYSGQENLIWRQWMKELGIQFVVIDPYNNCTMSTMGDKWIAPRPGTDAALAEAIAYVWLTEDTYDHFFVENRTYGFDEWKKHILGEGEDHTPKTPGWAAEICDVPASTITALAREWAAKKTMLAVASIFGATGACRQAYATEWCRLCVYLMSMQGMGKPGVNFWGGTGKGSPLDMGFHMFGYSDNGWDAFGTVAEKSYFPEGNPVTQKTYRLLHAGDRHEPARQLDRGGLLRQLHRAAVPPVHLSGAGAERRSHQDDPPPRRLLHQHHDRDQQVGADVPASQPGVRGHPGLPLAERDQVRRRHPARHHQLRALRPLRVGRGRRLRLQRLQQQPPHLHLPAQVHRAAVGVQARLRDLHAAGREAGVQRPVHRGPRLRGLEPHSVRQVRSAQVHHLRGVQEEGLLRGAVAGPTTRNRGCLSAGSTKAATPTCSQSRGLRRGRRTTGRIWPRRRGKVEFVSQTLMAFDPDDKERPPMARYIPSWEGHEHQGSGGEVPAADDQSAPALLVSHPQRQQGLLAGRHTAAPRQEGRLLLVAGAHQHGGCPGPRHQRGRHRQALQRPRHGALHSAS